MFDLEGQVYEITEGFFIDKENEDKYVNKGDVVNAIMLVNHEPSLFIIEVEHPEFGVFDLNLKFATLRKDLSSKE